MKMIPRIILPITPSGNLKDNLCHPCLKIHPVSFYTEYTIICAESRAINAKFSLQTFPQSHLKCYT